MHDLIEKQGMTREEAAEMIKNDMRLHHDYLSGEYRKALRMAISALEQPEIIRCKDCIWWRDEDCTNPVGMFLPEEDSFCSCATRRREDG